MKITAFLICVCAFVFTFWGNDSLSQKHGSFSRNYQAETAFYQDTALVILKAARAQLQSAREQNDSTFTVIVGVRAEIAEKKAEKTEAAALAMPARPIFTIEKNGGGRDKRKPPIDN